MTSSQTGAAQENSHFLNFVCVASENIVPNAQEMSLPANKGSKSPCWGPSQTHTTQGGPGLNEEAGWVLVTPVGTADP